MQDLSIIWLIASFVAGILLGGVITRLIVRARLQSSYEMLNAFKALAADSLNQNNQAFLHLAETRLKQSEQAANATLSQKTTAIDEMVKPIKESLQKVDAQLHAIEIERKGAYCELKEMVSSSRETHQQLRNETSQLLQALRAPTGRGRWGELQLQRILEMTGMSIHTKDFSTQTTFSNDDRKIRPDMIVNLPGKRCIIIDSKVPLMAYLDSVQTNDDVAKQASMKQHSKQLRDHIKTLSDKAYWEQIEGTAEFVVLFLPGEHFLSAALDNDPDLMEYSTTHKVVLATPMTLIALLRTAAYGWRQESLRENVMQVADIGSKLFGALIIFAKQMEILGSRISGTVETYNKTISALEKNVFSNARQLSAFGVAPADTELNELAPVERITRSTSTIIESTNEQNDAA